MDICIPTYPPHYKYVEKFIDTYYIHCKNVKNIRINVIISSGEEDFFKKFGNKINVITLKTLIKNVDGVDINEEYLLNSMSKYSFQSIKKIYSSIFFKDSIIFDSENECVNDFTEDEVGKFIIDNQNKIYFSKLSIQPLQSCVIRNSNNLLLNPSYNSNIWMFVQSYWVFNNDVVCHMKKFLEDTHGKKLYELFKENILFEYVLYTAWCYIHQEKYNMKFINLEDILPKTIVNKIIHPWNSEYVCRFVDDINISQYCDYLNSENILISRLHWMDENNKKSIIDNTIIKIGTLHYD
jgi:hypothetical protein